MQDALIALPEETRTSSAPGSCVPRAFSSRREGPARTASLSPRPASQPGPLAHPCGAEPRTRHGRGPSGALQGQGWDSGLPTPRSAPPARGRPGAPRGCVHPPASALQALRPRPRALLGHSRPCGCFGPEAQGSFLSSAPGKPWSRRPTPLCLLGRPGDPRRQQLGRSECPLDERTLPMPGKRAKPLARYHWLGQLRGRPALRRTQRAAGPHLPVPGWSQ